MTGSTRADRVWGVVNTHAEGLGVAVSVHSLCQAAAQWLPVTDVAVSIRGGRAGSEVLAASGPRSREYEELQLTAGEGPSLDVLAGGTSLLVGDLDSPGWKARWPVFASQALQAGTRAVFALQLDIGRLRIGVLVLYCDHSGALGAETLAEAYAFAEIALRLVLDEQASIDSPEGYPALDWLNYRPEIPRATGMIAVQLGITIGQAWIRLRARAFAQGRPLSELAADVVAHRLQFDPEETA
ncbi:MAG: ANTAR domain-containing protein [Pseudonocardiaceae bacterium]